MKTTWWQWVLIGVVGLVQCVVATAVLAFLIGWFTQVGK